MPPSGMVMPGAWAGGKGYGFNNRKLQNVNFFNTSNEIPGYLEKLQVNESKPY